MSNRPWWRDKVLLDSQGLEVSYDPVHRRMSISQYRYQEPPEARIYYLTIDMTAAELGDFTLERALECFEYQHRLNPDYQHPGPTTRDLQHPVVKEAWDQFQVLLRLSVNQASGNKS